MINYLTTIKSYLVIALGMILLGSCNLDNLPNLDNTYLPNYEGSVALLLVNDTVNIREILEETITDTSTYDITAEERIIFSYEIETDYELGSEFVEINSFEDGASIPSPIKSFFIAPIDTFVIISHAFSFDFPTADEEQLDSIYYKDADFTLEFISTFPYEVDYQISVPSFVNLETGDSIAMRSVIDPSGLPPARDIGRFDLSGYRTSLVSESDSNKFFINLDAKIFLKAGEVLSGNEFIELKLSIDGPEYDVIFGSFGKDTFDVEEQRIDLSFFEDLGGDGIVFESPRIEFNINNGFGLPTGLDFSRVYALKDSDTIHFSGSFADNPQTINAAPVANHGEVVNTIFEINENNSNLRDLLASSPDEMVFNLSGYSNYDSDQSNWLDTESAMDITAKVSIPMSFQINAFEYENEVELDDLSQLEGTQELTLLINTVNQLPLDGSLDLFMLDEDSVVINSVEGSVLFSSPTQFDANGRVLEPSMGRSEITLNADQIAALIEATTLKTVIRLESYNASQDEFVEVFADYTLQLKIGIAGTVSVDLNGE